jgi:purine-nucleoside/S-methyl-5'-thioadenosine phosphorylase / adenosine deaminase
MGVYHAIFTRHGGISPKPWESLNFGASVGDDTSRVVKNRELALCSLGLIPESVYDVYQIHSTNIVVTDRPLNKNETHIKADAILTDRPYVTLLMRFADCVPILLFDPVKRAIGIVHAGWVGTVDKIIEKGILEMSRNYGTSPKDLIAAIGPSIGPDHYSIGEDVLSRIQSSYREDADQLVSKCNGNWYFDLWKANMISLHKVGVDKIEVAEICTYCNMEDWFSHRGENGRTGRFGVVFGLSE